MRDPILPRALVVWDETLRDGEQAPGVHFTIDEKVELAKMLDEAGCAVINCGIPAVSERELQSVKAVAKEGLARACVLAAARTVRSDIDAVLRSDAQEISLFIAVSDLHLEKKLRMDRDRALSVAVDAVGYAVDHGLPVSFVAEDTSRADPAFATRVYEACVEAGAHRIVMCDTVGVLTPRSTQELIEMLRREGLAEGFPMWAFHNHNDLGLATANALAAFEAGVPCLHTTVNGIGERAGNAPLAEVVMALETLYGYKTGIRTELLTELSQKVEELSGIPAGPLKPVVGLNAFTHESGVHTHGVLADPATYEPFDPGSVGQLRRFAFGKHTGTAAVEDRLVRAGFSPSPEDVRSIVHAIKTAAESQRKDDVAAFVRAGRAWHAAHQGLPDETFWSIVEEVTERRPTRSG